MIRTYRPHPSTPMLQELIARSLFVREDQRATLLSLLPSLTPEQEKTLEQFLETGQRDVMDTLLENAVFHAIENGDEAFLQDLTAFAQKSQRSLLHGSETAERTREIASAERLLDDA